MTAPSKYAEAGVDIDTGNAIVRDIKQRVRATFTPEVLTDIGLFGGLFDASGLPYRQPVLVSSIDGVGTKLHIAAALGRFRGVGHDIVAHCCNDIAVQGARPLFFLDYVAAARLTQEAVVAMVAGMADECKANGCALIGGETAEMPGTYAAGQYDLVGCIVGVVERGKIINGARIVPGDVAIGIASSGLHTNGYSLARRALLHDQPLALDAVPPGCDRPLADILLEPHHSYAPLILRLAAMLEVKGIAHITGGGLLENVPRILPAGVDAVFDVRALAIPPIYRLIAQRGGVAPHEMFRVFNMGTGLVVFVAPAQADTVCAEARRQGHTAAVIGAIAAGARTVQLEHLPATL
jgi:phosphoribosylformylglycinamidine cyclo-ligase